MVPRYARVTSNSTLVFATHSNKMATDKWTVQDISTTRRWPRLYLAVVLFAALHYYHAGSGIFQLTSSHLLDPETLAKREHILAQCKYIKTPAGPPSDFHSRQQSDRYVPGTKPTLITNATIWTAGQNGTEVINGNLLLHEGMIKAVGKVPLHLSQDLQLDVIDVHGAWVTPGLVDLHSHLGVFSTPLLSGRSFRMYIYVSGAPQITICRCA